MVENSHYHKKITMFGKINWCFVQDSLMTRRSLGKINLWWSACLP